MSKKNKKYTNNKKGSTQREHLPKHAKYDNRNSIPIIYAVLMSVLVGLIVAVVIMSTRPKTVPSNTADDTSKETIITELITEKEKTSELIIEGKFRIDEVTVYYFDGNGKGSLHTDFNDYSFSYSITDNTLTIDFEDKSLKDSTYTYYINKEALLLKNDTRTYELKKET